MRSTQQGVLHLHLHLHMLKLLDLICIYVVSKIGNSYITHDVAVIPT